MTTYSTISNPSVAVGGIPSSATVTALRDNPIAIAEASSGAPVIAAAWHPYDKVTVGDSATGLLYNSAVNGTVSSVVTPNFEDGWEYRLVIMGLSHNNVSTQKFELENYGESAGSYLDAWSSAVAYNSAQTWDLDVEFFTPRISRNAHYFRITGQVSGTTLLADTGGFFGGGTDKLLKVRISFTNGASTDAGKIYLLRRREYISSP
jgi:hypothetical protein